MTAQEIKRDVVLANFRPSKRDRMKRKPTAAEKREGMSEGHLKLIRQLPCCVCGRPGPSDPHHLKANLSHERGVGRRATDRWAVPICRMHHDEVEAVGSRNETSWFAYFGIDPLELASALWNATGDRGRMLRILLAHITTAVRT